MPRGVKSKERKTGDQPSVARGSDEQQASASEAPARRGLLPEKLSLQILVFVAGGVLMGLEIAGSRVLAPHFGNSVFVWGSLISIFLMALSLGYYIGGRVADEYPSRLLLNSICGGVSLLIFGIALFANSICGWLVAQGLGEQSGPFIASMILFLPASIGMGMVSPLSVRLGTHSVLSVGKIAGTLYALSTLGSIAGTLLTTFVLIPLLGLAFILKGLALVLLIAAIVTLPAGTSSKSFLAFAGLALLSPVLLLSSGAARLQLGPGDRVVLDVDTPYHHISVVDVASGRYEVRQLRFDRFVESSVLKSPPYPSTSPYTDYFHLAFLVKPHIDRTVFIGAGGGVGPRAFHMQDPDMQIDVVDIDPEVLEVARNYFYLDDDPHIRCIPEDGRMFMRKAEEPYDGVILDAFTIGGRIPFHLVTREFFQLCSDRMTDDGVFVMNINSALEGPSARIYESIDRTLSVVFPHVYVFAVGGRQWGYEQSMNVMFVATRSDADLLPADWKERAAQFESHSYVDSARLSRMIEDLVPDPPTNPDAPLFTDDYAPIETMSF